MFENRNNLYHIDSEKVLDMFEDLGIYMFLELYQFISNKSKQ